MKVQNLFILGMCLILSCKMFGQDSEDKSIVGTWVSEEDYPQKIVFTSDGICKRYSENKLFQTATYKLSNTSPQCGQTVTIDDKSLFLSLKETDTGDEYCYYVNGITDKFLSLNYFDGGGVMVFLRSQKETVSMKPGFNNAGSTISNEGLIVSCNLSFNASTPMKPGINYLVSNIQEYFRPEVAHSFSVNTNANSWLITIKPNGNVYCRLKSGKALPIHNTVKFKTLKYALYKLESNIED